MVDLKVNKKLLPIKAHYFLFNAGTAPLMPYIPTYARQLGVPSSGVGIMYTIFPFVGLIAKPSFGALADKFNMGKVIFMTFIFLTAAFYCCMSLIPAKTTQAEMEIDCNGGMTLLKTCNIQDNCTLTRIDLEDPNHMMECKLTCNSPNADFLNQMCTAWNISDACTTSNLTVIELTTFSNTSGALYDYQSCLSFPVETVLYDQDYLLYHPSCDGASMKCNVVCDSAIVMSYLQDQVIDNPEENYWSTIQFQMLFCLMCGAWASMAVVVSLSDSICFALLGDKPQDYGVQRLWGAVGWGLMAVIAGYLIDLASAGQLTKNYTPSFYLVGIILAINFFSVIPIKVEYRREPKAFKKTFSLVKNVRVVLFLCSCITFGICIGSIWQFHLMFLEDLAAAQGCDSLQWIKLLEGLAMGVQCFAGEAPFLFMSGWFIRKLGHVYTMTMILLVMGIRLLCYSFLVNPWYTLPIDLLNGLTLGVYWSAMASYADEVAPAGASATLQGIFGAIFEGIGTSIGSLLGGFIFENYGGAILFRSFGIYTLVYGSIYCLVHIIMNRVGSKSSKELDATKKETSNEDSFSSAAVQAKGEKA